MNKIGFGGGCHWCTEAIFQSLHGVDLGGRRIIKKKILNDSYSEGIIVHFNTDISIETLLEVHLLTHSSTSLHSMRKKYRSAVYYFDVDDKAVIEFIIKLLGTKNKVTYITQALPFVNFKENAEHFLNYYKRNKKGPFCQTYIDPKLAAIRKKFGRQFRSDF